MKAHLVAVLDHGFDGSRILLDAPGGNEERLLDAITAISLKNAWHANLRPIAQHGDGRNPLDGVLRVLNVDKTIRIHVKSNRTGNFRTVRPGNWIHNHGLSPLVHHPPVRCIKGMELIFMSNTIASAVPIGYLTFE